MLGPAILAAPVMQEGATERNVTLPTGVQWFEAASGELVSGSSWTSSTLNLPVTMDSIPYYLRGGSILPFRERARRSSVAAALV